MSLDVVLSQDFSNFNFALMRQPTHNWHAIQVGQVNPGTGDSLSLFMNCGDPKQLEALGTFFTSAAEKVREAHYKL